MMEETRKFPPPKEFSVKAHIKSLEEYKKLYKRSIEDPENFWGEQAQNLEWFQKWSQVLDYSFQENIYIKWFQGGKLNVTVNCLDRHLKTARKNKAAIIWEGEPGESQTYSYEQLYGEVCKFANVLKKKGIKKGDRVTIYMPMIPELPIAMLACARIGAIHSIVFGGFSADALKDRILDAKGTALITTDASFRSGKVIGLKNNADAALANCPAVKTVIVCNRTNTKVDVKPGRDFWWHEEMAAPDIKPVCEPEVMDAEDPLFIHFFVSKKIEIFPSV
ncbi:MAG: AMP-binding protein [Proteobacteria bacterium]|nr:AMP-binding protein [Pseudomonadota bacterium]